MCVAYTYYAVVRFELRCVITKCVPLMLSSKLQISRTINSWDRSREILKELQAALKSYFCRKWAFLDRQARQILLKYSIFEDIFFFPILMNKTKTIFQVLYIVAFALKRMKSSLFLVFQVPGLFFIPRRNIIYHFSAP